MFRARSVLKVGLIAVGVIVLILLVTIVVYGEFRLANLIDLVWKVLVLVLLADISMKLDSRNRGS